MKFQLAAALFCCGIALHAQSALRLSGSTTVKGALEPNRSAIESAVGRPIELSGIGTTNGLVSLATGGADVAMLSTPLEDVARSINRKAPGRIDPAQFRAVHIGEARIIFVVNPRNPVRSLSAAQLADVLTGKVRNWKEVGGDNIPILVVSLSNGGPLLEGFLHRQPITGSARTVPNATQIPVIVAQEANAIGILSSSHARGQTSVIQTDARLATPLFLVTKGEPSADAKKLFEAARRALGGS